MRAMSKKVSAFLLAVVLLFTTIFGGIQFGTSEATAAELPESIKMPITIYDHLDDSMLFEYNMDAVMYLDLDLDLFLGDITGQGRGKGLVETTLGSNGTPVYTQFTVERTAEEVKEFISWEWPVTNDFYWQLVNQIKDAETGEIRLGDYATSKAKFDNGGKVKDIATCMDYAYYVLNTFWTDTNGDITQKTDTYKSITLNNYEENIYEFSSDMEMIYDLENKNIASKKQPYTGEGFFPLDKDTLGEKSDLKDPFGAELYPYGADGYHNYHFAMKANCEFMFNKADNLEFTFMGDDDVYLYIDGKLVLDLGGAHEELEQTIYINEIADEIGLKEGNVYSFDFFYMERHTSESNLKIQTNILLDETGASSETVLKDTEGNVIPDGTEVEVGSEVEINYSVTAEDDDMTDVTFKDTGLDVVIGKDEIDLGDNVYVKDEITVTVTDPEGNVTETHTISKEDLEDPEKVKEFQEEIGDIVVDKGETITVSGIYTEVEYDEVLTPDLDVDITGEIKKYNDQGKYENVKEDITAEAEQTTVIPTSTPKALLNVDFVDESDNNLPANVSEGTYVGVNYTLTADSNNMKNIGITDKATGFAISDEGITIPEGYDVNDKLVVSLVDANGNISESIELTKSDIENKTGKYAELMSKLSDGDDAWELNKGDSIAVTGVYKNIGNQEIKSDAEGSITGPVPSYNAETGELTVNYQEVNPTDCEKVCPIPNVNVKFVINPEEGTLDGDTEFKVNIGEKVEEQPVVNENDGYEFVKWTMTVDGVTTDVEGDPKDVTVTKDTVFTAVLAPKNYPYTVKYVDKATGEEIAEAKNAEATYGEEVTEEAITIPGYRLSGDAEKTITIDTENNVIVFEYVKGEYPYTVKYVDKATGEEIADSKNDTAIFNETVTETAVDVKGYTLSGDAEKSIVIDTENNEIIFEYEKNTYPYTVKYVDKATGEELIPSKEANAEFAATVTETAVEIGKFTVSGDDTQSIVIDTENNEIVFQYEKNKVNVEFKAEENGTVEGDLEQSVEIDDTVESVPTPVPEEGYEFAGWDKTTSEGTVPVENPAEEIITEDTVFTATFAPKDYPYTVKYVDKATGEEIAPTKDGEDTVYGETVTENAIDVKGYTVSGDAEKSIVIDTENNEIVFEYTINEYLYTVKYVEKATGKELLASKTESATYNTTVTEKAVDIEGYSLDGDAEKSIVIGADKNEIIFEYVVNEYPYTVKYVDKETGKEIVPTKTGEETPYGETVTETAVTIPGYGVVGDEEQTITIKTEGNEIVFEYEKGKYPYTVKYVDAITGEEIAPEKIGENTPYGETVYENAIDVKGYTLSGDAEKSIVIDTENNEIIFEYVVNEYPYTVKYVDKATGEELIPSKEANAEFAATVTETAVEIDKYTVSGDDTQSIVIDTENNEIVFQYEKNKVNVEFKAEENGTVEGDLEQSVEIDDTVESVPTPVPEEGYEFAGWDKTTSEGTVPVENPAEEIITEDTVFTATFAPKDYPYTVKYVDKATGEEISASKTAEATFKTDVTENAIDVEGYTLSGDEEQTITIKTEGNEIIFEYEKNSYPYTVKYVDATTGEDIAPVKNGADTPYGETVTETAVTIPGYGVVGEAEQTITIKTESNEIVFEYEKGKYPYTVKYVNKETGEEVAPSKTGDNTTYGETVTENAIDVKGYTVSGDAEKSIVIDTENNEIIFEYVVNEYPYTVKYVDKATGEEIADAKTVEATPYGETVTENAIDVKGYTVSGDAEKSIVIDTENNEIIFEYDRNELEVIFVADEHGTVEGELEQTVLYGDKVTSVPTPVPDKGYEFLGWDKVVSEGVSKSENPADEVITENTEFVAKFGPKDYPYVVKYVDEEGNDLATEFRGEDKTFGTEVTEVPVDVVGYTPKEESKTIVINDENNEIIFVYTKNAYDYVVKYVDKNGEDVAPSVTKTAEYGTTVTESPITVDGYVTSETEKSIEIKTEGNEIIFVYEKVEEPTTPEETTTPESDRDTDVAGVKDYNDDDDDDGYAEVEVDDANDNDGNNNGNGESEGTSNNGTISPKTGYELTIFAMFATLMIAALGIIVAGLNIRKCRNQN